MKKLAILLTLVIIGLSFSSCKLDDVSNITADTVEIYSTNILTSFTKGEAKDAGLNLPTKSKTFDNVSQTKKEMVGNVNAVLKYITTSSDSDNIPFDNYNRAFDWYSGETNIYTVSIRCLHDSNKIRYYSIHKKNIDSSDAIKQPGLTDEKVIKTATSFLRDKFNITNIEEYDLKEFSLQRTKYSLLFQKSIHGYSTDDKISTDIALNGKVSFCDARKYGLLNGIEKKYSKKRIDATYEVLTQLLPEFQIVDEIEELEPMLTTNIYGELFVYVTVNHIFSDGLIVLGKIFAKVPLE